MMETHYEQRTMKVKDMKRIAAIGVLALVWFAGCSKSTEEPKAEKEQPKAVESASELQAYCEKIASAVRADDAVEAGRLCKALLPDQADLGIALRDDVGDDVLEKIAAMHAGLREMEDDRIASGFDAEQSEVVVHAATTEEIIAYEEGTAVYEEFPGGARDVAKSLLKPGKTFYEVEFLRPGHERGYKLHLLYWDGADWRMLGGAWRALR